MLALLHIYPHECWHDEVKIVGNREGLEKLKLSIQRVLDAPGDQAIVKTGNDKDCIFATDGEGYNVVVIRNDTGWHDPFWTSLILPYTDDLAKDTRENALDPFKFLTMQQLDEHYPLRDKRIDADQYCNRKEEK